SCALTDRCRALLLSTLLAHLSVLVGRPSSLSWLRCTMVHSLFFYSFGLHRGLPSFPTHALPISMWPPPSNIWGVPWQASRSTARSEEHTSELQSRENLVCRLLLEKERKNGARLELHV